MLKSLDTRVLGVEIGEDVAGVFPFIFTNTPETKTSLLQKVKNFLNNPETLEVGTLHQLDKKTFLLYKDEGEIFLLGTTGLHTKVEQKQEELSVEQFLEQQPPFRPHLEVITDRDGISKKVSKMVKDSIETNSMIFIFNESTAYSYNWEKRTFIKKDVHKNLKKNFLTLEQFLEDMGRSGIYSEEWVRVLDYKNNVVSEFSVVHRKGGSSTTKLKRSHPETQDPITAAGILEEYLTLRSVFKPTKFPNIVEELETKESHKMWISQIPFLHTLEEAYENPSRLEERLRKTL